MMGGPKDPAARRAYNQAYYAAHKEELLPKSRTRVKAWAATNKERRAATCRELRSADPVRHRTYQRTSRLRLKSLVFAAYGGKCSCCGETGVEFLTVDHVANDGAAHRKLMRDAGKRGSGDIYRYARDNNYPASLQLLCWNCNMSKRLGRGVCAHQRGSVP